MTLVYPIWLERRHDDGRIERRLFNSPEDVVPGFKTTDEWEGGAKPVDYPAEVKRLEGLLSASLEREKAAHKIIGEQQQTIEGQNTMLAELSARLSGGSPVAAEGDSTSEAPKAPAKGKRGSSAAAEATEA